MRTMFSHAYGRLFLSLGAGSLAALSMAPLNAWYILFPAFSIFYVCLSKAENKKQAFATGWLFSFGYFLFGLSWVGNALLVEGNPYRWAWPLAVCGLPFILAPFPAIACLSIWRFFDLKKISGYLAFTAFLAISEWLRGHMFTGFPWNLYGYTWADIAPITQTAAIGSIYLLTFFTILWAVLPGFLLIAKSARRSKIALGCFVVSTFTVLFVFGWWRIESYTPQYIENVGIKIVAPYIPQAEKWDNRKVMQNYFKLIRDTYPSETDRPQDTTIIVWPETALNHFIAKDSASMNVLSQALRSYGQDTYLVTGTLREAENNQNIYNAIVVIDQNGHTMDQYNKHHLVPFGEYIPFKEYIPLEPINNFSGFLSGDGSKTMSINNAVHFSPLVCYEGIFPLDVVNDEQKRPDILINATNDAWYAGAAGPAQHFVQSSFRAIEEGISFARAANGGVSALINPIGQALYTSDIQNNSKSPILKIEKRIPINSTFFYFRNICFWFVCFASMMPTVIHRRLQ